MLALLQHHLHRVHMRRMFVDLILLLALAAMLPSLFLHAPMERTLPSGLLLGSGILTINSVSGFYERVYSRPFAQTFARGLMATVLALLVAWAVVSWAPGLGLLTSEGTPLLKAYALGSTLAVMGWRTAASHRYGKDPIDGHRVLVLGTGEAALEVARTLAQAQSELQILGHVSGPREHDARPQDLHVLPRTGELADMARQHKADEIVVALSERRGGATPLRELLDCRIQGIEVNDINTHFERTLGQIRLERLTAHWLIFGDGFSQDKLRRAVKRVFDLAFAVALLIIGLPIMAVTAIAIKLESRGPVLYRQERTGLGGRVFEVLKMRSMRIDAESDGKPRWATTNDSRITRVGRFIRATRIDELPQLLNVLKGEMSLVGPRPERPFFVEQLNRELPFYAVRHSVKPGLTGWAQVRCDYGSTVEEARNKLQYDLYYVKNHSLFLDLLIVLETVGVVLTGKGAR